MSLGPGGNSPHSPGSCPWSAPCREYFNCNSVCGHLLWYVKRGASVLPGPGSYVEGQMDKTWTLCPCRLWVSGDIPSADADILRLLPRKKETVENTQRFPDHPHRQSTFVCILVSFLFQPDCSVKSPPNACCWNPPGPVSPFESTLRCFPLHKAACRGTFSESCFLFCYC